jgi:hypothetical protein
VFSQAKSVAAAIEVWIVSSPSTDEDHEACALASGVIAGPVSHPHPTYVLIVDQGVRPPNAAWRRRIAEASSKAAPGTIFAFVTSSPLARGAYTAINWLRAPPYQHASFESLEHAERWIEGLRGPVPELWRVHAEARHGLRAQRTATSAAARWGSAGG